jgi:O-antigen/teichoic acid export membrane protein
MRGGLIAGRRLSDPADIEGQAPATPRRRRSLTANVAALLASQVTTWALSSLLLVLQPRLLGPAELGDLRLAAAIWMLAGVVYTWGTNTVLRIQVARDHQQAWPLSRAVVRLRIVLWLMMLPFVAAFVLVADYGARLAVLIGLAGVAAIVGVWGASYREALIGMEEMSTVGKNDVVMEAVTVITVVAALIAGAKAIGVVIVMGVVAMLMNLVFHRALARLQPRGCGSALAAGRRLLRAATPYLFVDATLVVYQQVDTVIISLLVGSAELGYYSTADTLFGSLLFVPTVVMTALFPSFARLNARTSNEGRDLLERIFRLLLVIGTWIGLGTLLVSKSFVALLFGPKFANTAPVLAVFGVVTILSYVSILFGTYAVTAGRATTWTTFMVISIVASIPLDLVLVRWTADRYGNGAIGGALAYVVTELFQVVAGIVVLAPHLASRRTLTRVGRVGIAGAALLAAGWPLRERFFLISAVVGSAAFLIVLVILRTFDSGERDIASNLAGKVTRRWRVRHAA